MERLCARAQRNTHPFCPLGYQAVCKSSVMLYSLRASAALLVFLITLGASSTVRLAIKSDWHSCWGHLGHIPQILADLTEKDYMRLSDLSSRNQAYLGNNTRQCRCPAFSSTMSVLMLTFGLQSSGLVFAMVTISMPPKVFFFSLSLSLYFLFDVSGLYVYVFLTCFQPSRRECHKLRSGLSQAHSFAFTSRLASHISHCMPGFDLSSPYKQC